MFNFITENPYSGKNVQILAEFMTQNGFKTPKFLTFLQAKSIGLSVKGEHGAQILKVVRTKVTNPKTGKTEWKKVPKRYTVFNIEQTKVVEE